MVGAYSIYILASIFSAGVSLVLAVIAFRRYRSPGASALGWLMLGVSVWCMIAGLGLASRTAEQAYLAIRALYTLVAVVPVLWVGFTTQYIRRRQSNGRHLIHLLWIGPLISICLVWTNQWNHQFWKELEIFWVDGFVSWEASFGPAFWFHSIYSYSLILLGGYILLNYAFTNFSVYRAQAITLLAGALAPLLTSLPAILGLSKLPLTSFGLLITGLVFTWAMLYSNLFDLRPIGRDLLIEQMRDGMIIVDARNLVVDANPPALLLLGGDEKRVIGRSAEEILQQLTGQQLLPSDLSHFKSEIVVVRQGEKSYYTLSLTPLSGGSEQPIGRLIHLHEITALKKIEQALRVSESRSQAILSALPDRVHLISEDGGYQIPQEARKNRAAVEVPSLFDLYPAPLAEEMLKTVREAIASGSCRSFTYQLDAEDGNELWFEARTAPLAAENGGQRRVVWIDRDITERVQLYQKVEFMANTDPLTGLVNRRHFFDLAQEFAHRQPSTKTPCAFILIDIDHFKAVNDRFGHLVGDQVLPLVSARLVQQVRAGDIVARYGGEEFVIFLPNTSPVEAEQIAHRLCRVIASEPFALGPVVVSLSISLGLVNVLVDEGLQIDETIQQADDALYAAKRSGRNTVKVYPFA